MPTIALYTSSHGFGHAVRCAILCRALLMASPGLRIVVRTAAPAWIFPAGAEVEPCVIDVGVVQPNSLDIDARATLERYAGLVEHEEARIEDEAARVREIGARALVADVPSAAFAIAARAGVPGIGLANFSWDWIYGPFVEQVPEYAPLLERLRAQYGQASLLLRLPFHGGLTAFPTVEDVPLIARRATTGREETRRRLGLPLDLPLVLFSFGGHADSGPDQENWRRSTGTGSWRRRRRGTPRRRRAVGRCARGGICSFCRSLPMGTSICWRPATWSSPSRATGSWPI